MALKAHYEKDLKLKNFKHDPIQEKAIEYLQTVYDELVSTYPLPPFKKALQKAGFLKPKRIKGVYLWGGVGIGKTYLMDLFYENLPFHKKSRMHFHVFMKETQDDLKRWQGMPDPLKKVAERIAKQAHVICFDEFFVSDIADAMILGGLFEALFERGVCLVTTSNIEPSGLYPNGLQRERFLPTIDLLNKHTMVFHMQGDLDYRLQALAEDGLYFYPLKEATATKMQHHFELLTQGAHQVAEPLVIEARVIETVAYTHAVAWFEFKHLCHVPRSQRDYLAIARLFHTVLLGRVPKIPQVKDDWITYFIHLVDVFYDANVRLILSADVPMEEIYTAGRKVFEFERTLSRLKEMQTLGYLRREHVSA